MNDAPVGVAGVPMLRRTHSRINTARWRPEKHAIGKNRGKYRPASNPA
jgi:hypothetical protein